VHGVQCLLHHRLLLQAGGFPLPPVEQAVEGAEQEVAGAAGGVDHAEALERALVQGGLQGAVEDELLHEERGLK